MKLIIAGGRDYFLTKHDYDRLDNLGAGPITEVVCGCASGADSCGAAWATIRGIPVKYFRPNWRAGKQAGILRNLDMADYGDAVALFPGGTGTAHMYLAASAKHLLIFDFRNRP